MIGIDAVRLLLPLCWIDGAKCAQGLEGLWTYHKEWDDKRKEFRDKPFHDWASHPADALRTYAVSRQVRIDTSRLRAPQLSIA